MHTVDRTDVAGLLSTFVETLGRIEQQLHTNNQLLLQLLGKQSADTRKTKVREKEAIALIDELGGNTAEIARRLNLPRKTVASWPEFSVRRKQWLAAHPRALRVGNLAFDPSDIET